MRDEELIQKKCKDIYSYICDCDIKDIDDTFLDEIEYNTSDKKDYTVEDYKIMFFNLLNITEGHYKFLRKGIKKRDKLIISLFNRIKIFNNTKIKIDDLKIYNGKLDIIEMCD